MQHLGLFFSLATLLAAGLQGLAGTARASETQRVEVAFVLDTTGSMGDLIDGAKKKIWSIANTIVDQNPDADIAMALVAYRDRGDEYVVKTAAPMSEDIQSLYGRLMRIEADGGDDTPESVNAALNTAVSGLQWSSGPEVKRIVFLVGDAPPHMDYVQEKQYPAVLREAVRRNIIVNAVQAGDMAETTEVWKEIAQFGRGRYMAIPQNGGEVSIIITPYDEDILHLQKALDETVVPYGSREKRDGLASKMADKAAAPVSVQVENAKYYAKRSARKEVVTGGGDLIADIRNGRTSLPSIKEGELPDELAGMDAEARQAWFEARLASRQRLEEKLSDVIKQRDAYAAVEQQLANHAKAKDSFDAAVAETLKLQLE
jgi:hypothetical protein